MARIYTKTGDKGDTGLFGGERVPKSHPRIEAYGTIDELNSWLGLIHSLHHNALSGDLIQRIQSDLFTIGALLSSTGKKKDNLPSLNPESVRLLEKSIDDADQNIPPLKSFILPGGNTVSAYCHLARTVCRRAERRIVALEGDDNHELIIQYINRLSDLLFVMARKVTCESGDIELTWKP